MELFESLLKRSTKEPRLCWGQHVRSSRQLLNPETGKPSRPEGTPVCDPAGRMPPLTRRHFYNFLLEKTTTHSLSSSPEVNSGIEPACQKCAFSHSFIIYRTLLCAGPRRCSQNRTACYEEGNGEALKGRVSPGTDCFGPHHLPGSARSRCVCVKGIFNCRDHGHSLRAFVS